MVPLSEVLATPPEESQISLPSVRGTTKKSMIILGYLVLQKIPEIYPIVYRAHSTSIPQPSRFAHLSIYCLGLLT